MLALRFTGSLPKSLRKLNPCNGRVLAERVPAEDMKPITFSLIYKGTLAML